MVLFVTSTVALSVKYTRSNCPSCGQQMNSNQDRIIDVGIPPDPEQQEPETNYQPQYNQPQYNQPQYDQPQYNQPQYNQPQYDQAQYNQPEYNQPQYNQPPYNEPQYNQPRHSQPQYNQPRYSQPQQYNGPQYNEPRYSQPQQYNGPQYNEPRYSQVPQQYNGPQYNEPRYSHHEPLRVPRATRPRCTGSECFHHRQSFHPEYYVERSADMFSQVTQNNGEPWGVFSQMIHEQSEQLNQEGNRFISKTGKLAEDLKTMLNEKKVEAIDKVSQLEDEITAQFQRGDEESIEDKIRYGKISLCVSVFFVILISIYFIVNNM